MSKVLKNIDTKRGFLYYSQKEKVMMSISNQILIITILICSIVLSFNYLYSPAEIEGVSMLPTYNNAYVKNKNYKDIAYYTTSFSLNRGDVVIPDYKDDSGEKYLIKRLIAFGGDKVEFIDYQLYVNGEKINETYIESLDKNKLMINKFMIATDIFGNVDLTTSPIAKWETITLDTENISEKHISFTINDGYVFYLGDNRGKSYDCSSYGPQKEEIIVAKVVFVVPYGQDLVTTIWQEFLHKVFNY